MFKKLQKFYEHFYVTLAEGHYQAEPLTIWTLIRPNKQKMPGTTSVEVGTRMIDTLQNTCAVWPKGTRPADFHQPLKTGKPVLLLSGEYDQVTPPCYGEQVAANLSNARHFVLTGQGHNVMNAGCAPQVIKHFIEDLDPRALDGKCLDRLQRTPMFIDFNGATP